MKNVLFVDCCIRGEASRTKKLADAFLSALPADCRVTRLGLMAEELSYFKDGYFAQREQLLAQGSGTIRASATRTSLRKRTASSSPLRSGICPSRPC